MLLLSFAPQEYIAPIYPGSMTGTVTAPVPSQQQHAARKGTAAAPAWQVCQGASAH